MTTHLDGLDWRLHVNMNNPPHHTALIFDHFAKHAEFNFLLAFNVGLDIFCCVARKRGDGHWTGQLRGNPVELEDFPRVIDIYCEQSGRSAKVYIKTGSGVAGVED